MPRKYVVAGCGGVGGWLIPALAHFIEYRDPDSMLYLVDGDNFEEKNLERQDFREYGNKAISRAQDLEGRFHRVVIAPLPAWIVGADSTHVLISEEDQESSYVNVEDLVEEDSVTFAVVDNFATRKLIFDAARKRNNSIVISAGNDDDLFSSAYAYVRKDGTDVTDHPIVMHEYYNDPPDRNPGDLSCSQRATMEGGHQLLVANMAAATLALSMAHRFVFDNEEAQEHAEMYLDLRAMQASAANRAADPESIAMVDKLLSQQGAIL